MGRLIMIPSRTDGLIVAVVLTVVIVGEAVAQDAKQEIIDRCRVQLESYGAATVKYCVDHNLAAFDALAGYAETANEIVARCRRQMRSHGWATVKFCADQDIEAAEALASYPESAREIIARCQGQLARVSLK